MPLVTCLFDLCSLIVLQISLEREFQIHVMYIFTVLAEHNVVDNSILFRRKNITKYHEISTFSVKTRDRVPPIRI